MFKRLWFLLGLMMTTSCFGEQRIAVKEGDIATIRVSNTALNQIMIEGDRIQSVKGVSGQFQLDKDPHLGQIFIQPALDNKEPIHLFLTTEQGQTYSLSLDARDIPPESIPLIPKAQQSVAAKWEKSSSYEQILTQIIKAMHNQTLVEGFSIEEEHLKLPKIKEASVLKRKSYMGDKLMGEALEVQNISKSTLELMESDFYQPGIRAIAVLNKSLQPKGKTRVYVVRDK
jgi:type-F conjugative transfer system secretin TraK